MTGNLRIVAYNAHGVVVQEHCAHNVITSGGLSYMRDFLVGLAPNAPSYVAYGNIIESAGRFLTAVPGETFRAPIVYAERSGFAVTYHWWLTISDNAANTVGTYGLFGGAASAAADSGTLIAIADEPAPYVKSGALAYEGEWTVTLSGVVS